MMTGRSGPEGCHPRRYKTVNQLATLTSSAIECPRLSRIWRRFDARVPDKSRELLADLSSIEGEIARHVEMDDQIAIGDSNVIPDAFYFLGRSLPRLTQLPRMGVEVELTATSIEPQIG